jgi:ERCC4-related helicase
MSDFLPPAGEFVEVRGRRWLVEGVPMLADVSAVRLACVDDDAQGEVVEVAWPAELDARRTEDDAWSTLAHGGTDDPATFAAYLRTVKWNTATAADRDLFQAPFRAGIQLNAYQLLPLRKALRLPRVNLLIADDVGLGKTVEAGLIVRELLLRRRIDLIIVAAPAGMVPQWQDELETKFGLAFTIVDREHVVTLRRTRGFLTNPWLAGSRFLISHSLLTDETYVAGLREALGEFRPRSLLILDEAHHAAPSSGARYAVDSQFTRAMDELAALFEHRLFLSATPHNGHPNSFSRLLAMLDPQRFTRGVPVQPSDLEPIMVRRLKADLRLVGEQFPERVVEAIHLAGLSPEAPELILAKMLADYGTMRASRFARSPALEASHGRLAFVGLQQRLLSSIAAFAATLRVHKGSLATHGRAAAEAAAIFTAGAPDQEDEAVDEAQTERDLQSEEDAATEAATAIGAIGATPSELEVEIALVDRMLVIADQHKDRADARVAWLDAFVRRHMAPDGRWNDRRLVLFTEWEATRRWLQRRLNIALADLSLDILAGPRIAVFTGATTQDKREALKRAFNADPAVEPLRILICTDAAREGINLQSRCHDLIHIDLPWNPARLEQRNGRIDRKLQPSPKVWCLHFMFDQREEDIVLDALVRKTERIRMQLGSAGQVIGGRITDRLARDGIRDVEQLAAAVEAEEADDRERKAREDLDDEIVRRQTRLKRELDDLRKVLADSQDKVGVDAGELQATVNAALVRAHGSLDGAQSGHAGAATLFKLDAAKPPFNEPGWTEAFDDLRDRPRRRGERIPQWRATSPIRAVAFGPPTLPDGTEAPGIVQLHLEHRLVRRLLSRFLSQGFQSGLQRVCVIAGQGAQPRVVLLGRLALYGPNAARLHEEIIPVTAPWIEATRDSTPLRAFGDRGQETTLTQLDAALRDPCQPPPHATARARSWARKDAADLAAELNRRADAAKTAAEAALAARGREEAASLRVLLQAQRNRILAADREVDAPQLLLFEDEERKQLRLDRAYRSQRLQTLDREIDTEPLRVEQGYQIVANRLDPVGLVYLWPVTG